MTFSITIVFTLRGIELSGLLNKNGSGELKTEVDDSWATLGVIIDAELDDGKSGYTLLDSNDVCTLSNECLSLDILTGLLGLLELHENKTLA